MLKKKRLGICMLSVTPLNEILNVARVSEEVGIDSFWLAEGYHFFRDLGEPKSTTSIAAAIAMQSERITIGLGIVPPYTRHPSVLAMEAQTLYDLSDGRFVLGLGAAKAAALHIGYQEKNLKAVKTHREAIDLIREYLDGGAFCREGEVYSAAAPDRRRDLEKPAVPIVIGATGPKMLQLGGEKADAVLLPTFTTPRFVEYAMGEIAKGAARAGRSVDEVPVGATLPFSVATDGAEARDAIRGLTAVYISNKVHNIRNDIILSCAELTEDEALPIAKALHDKGLDSAAKLVTDEVLDKLVIAGNPDEVTKKLLALAECGLRLPLLYQVLGPERETAVRLIADRVKPLFDEQ